MTVARALILGSSGMLGRAWRGLLTAHGVPFEALDRRALDLADRSAVERLAVSGYSHVINCAAWTAVDDAETQLEGALRVNATAVGELARKCAEAGARFITYSTDYVFSGRGTAPYLPEDTHDPVNAYGRSKAAGENELREIAGDWLCIRTSWVYASWGKNFVRTIAAAARSRPVLRVVDDQRGRPSSAEALARTSLALTIGGARGIWHATDAGECTWHEFACEIVRLSGAQCRVEPCSSAEYPRPAARPTYSVLDLRKTEDAVGPMIPWTVSLTDVVRRLDVCQA